MIVSFLASSQTGLSRPPQVDIATPFLNPKAWVVTTIKSLRPLAGARSGSRHLAALFFPLLFIWASGASAAERIHHPKVGELYVYNARLTAVDVSAKTFTVGGIVDTRESLTLSVHPATTLYRAGGLVPLGNGRIGEPISGTLLINAKGKVFAVSTTFGAHFQPRAPLATRLVEVNGLASARHVRNPLRGNVRTSVMALPTGR